MFSNIKKIIDSRIVKGLWKDALPSYQPEGTYSDLWNGVVESDSENSFGVSNENSTRLFVNIEGEVRGLVFAEERDQYVVFVKNKDGDGELGIIDIRTKEYKILSKSPDLEVDCEEWHDMELKVLQPCNQLHLYWSSKDTYKTINLDDPCCEFKVKPLIKCDCMPYFDFSIYKNGGRLANGTYWFVGKLKDSDGNDTNWFKISRSIHISDGDHKPGEETNRAILIKLRGLNVDYSLLDIGIISTIAGITSYEQIDTVSYGESALDYLYTGKTGKETPLNIDIIRSRSNRYIRGKNLMQYDGHLVLYNLMSEHNLDYQKYANLIETGYVHYVVPAVYADQFKGLRPNENYWFGIRWNYCDGTSSADFDIPGRIATDAELKRIDDPCTDCTLPVWRVKDTSKRTKLHQFDVFDNGRFNDDIFIDDYSNDLNGDDVPLTEDEKDSIDELVPDDVPNFQEWRDKLDDYKEHIGKELDCLCAKLPMLKACNVDFPCIPVQEIYGKFTIAQLECICENRDLGIPPTPPPGGIQEVSLPEDIQNILDVLSDPEALAAVGCSGGNCGGNTGCVGGGCGGGGYSCGSCSGNCNGGDCRGGTCQNCGSSCTSSNCGSKNCSKVITYDSSDATNSYGQGRDIEVYVDYAINTIGSYMESLQNEAAKYNVSCDTFSCTEDGCIISGDGCVLIQTGHKCCQEGLTFNTASGFCIECKNGTWQNIINKSVLPSRTSYQRVKQSTADSALAATVEAPTFNFETIYDSEGCEAIGVRPLLYSEGIFGYWETKEIYPFTKDCNCEYIYGDLAGTPVRLHRVPSVSKEPYFVSFKGGVPNQYDFGNIEDKDSYVFFTGPRFKNIIPPKNLPKALCDQNPFSIVYVERTEANKSVVGTGVGISCFKGEIQGEAYAFPKHGVNSWERYDRSIEPAGTSTFRGGVGMDDKIKWDPDPLGHAPYIIHGFDFHANRPPLDATDALFELELYGKGFRHGLYAEDEKPITPWIARTNQKGTRQSLLLNHFRNVKNSAKNYVMKCVNAMSYAPTDSVISKSGKFQYPLCNLWREQSVYIELANGCVEFVEGDKNGMGDKYGGIRKVVDADTNTATDILGDNCSDRSFTGDILCHQMPIHDIRAHLITFTKYLPNQYGSPISQVFIPLGLEGSASNLAVGSIEGLVGDSFVGAMSFRRTSYVSDKTNRKIAPRVNPGAIAISSPIVRRMFGRLLDFIFRSLGVRDGGYIPKSCEEEDFVNRFGGLRDQGPAIRNAGGALPAPNGPTAGPGGTPQYKGEFIEGELPIPALPRVLSDVSDRNLGDNYWPHVLKSNVWLWLNSDANPAYRETGEEDVFETYWPKLKTQKLDSSMPDHWDWRKTYLNRFYIIWEANPRWKYIFASLFLFVFVWVIGLWLVVEGFGMMNNGFQAFGGGTYSLQTVGGVLGVIVALVVMAVGAWWMYYWAKNDFDNKFVENLIGLKNTVVDVRNPREPPATPGGTPNPPTYSTYDGKIRQFEDNYWRYNIDLSLPNTHEYGFGMSNVYNTCYCPEVRSTKVVYSNKQNIDSTIDAWSNFKFNNYIHIPPDTGAISKIFKLGQHIYVHTTDMILDLQAGSRTLNLDRGEILLGSGSLLGSPVPIYGGVVEGYAGLLDPNSAVVTNWGYIFPDREAKQLFVFSGSSPTTLSDSGVRYFMQENMGFSVLENFPGFEYVDKKLLNGIGYSIGVDHKNNRLLFTKKDYKLKDNVQLTYKNKNIFKDGDKSVFLGDPNYFCDNSFTMSYYLPDKRWISRHSYVPDIYVWDRFNMYSFNTKGLWEHNVKGNYQVFYDKLHPFVVEITARDTQGGFNFDYDGTILDTEAYQWNGYDFIRAKKITFDNMLAYNSFQSTGILNINIKDSAESIIDRSKTSADEVKFSYDHNVWHFNNINDKVLKPEEPLFITDCGNLPKAVNSGNIGNYVSSNMLSDNFIVYRFTFASREDVKLFMKGLFTKVNGTLLTP